MLGAIFDVDVVNDEAAADELLNHSLGTEEFTEADWNPLQRKIVDWVRSRRDFDELLLVGWILQLERERKQEASTELIAERLGISRDTLHRKYVKTGKLATARREARQFASREAPPVEGDPNEKARNRKMKIRAAGWEWDNNKARKTATA